MAKKFNISFERREEKVRKSLKSSILDGSFYSIMVGFGESFFSAFGVFLNATTPQLGLLSALPQAVGAIFQLFVMPLINFVKKRKSLVVAAAFLEGLMFLPILFCFYFGEWSVVYLIFFVTLYWIFRMLINPVWSSWMGDLVDSHSRGAYFGMRNNIAGFVSFVALLLAGFALQMFNQGEKHSFAGFAFLFVIALIARMFSVYFLSRMYEPPFNMPASEQFSFISFVKKARFNNYGLFVLFLSSMNFAVYIAAPFFTVYMLRDLKLDYMTFTIVTAAALVAKFLSMGLWGKCCDIFGSRKVLTFTSLLIPVVPVLWLFSTNVWYLIAIQLFSGFVWAGFDTASFNFILDSTSTMRRATCVAYYNLINGFAILAGALAGGFLVLVHVPFFWSTFYFIFFVSFILRYLVAFFFIPRIHEARHVESSSYKNMVFHMLSISANNLVHNLVFFVHHDPDQKQQKNSQVQKIKPARRLSA